MSFPSPEVESSLRSDFLYIKDNPLYQHITEELKTYCVADPKGFIASNILAINYGVYFYNIISHGAIYDPKKTPPVEFVLCSEMPALFVLENSESVYLNPASPYFETQFNHDPLENFPFVDEPEIKFPNHFVPILDGLEEANHLHLQKLQKDHGANQNSQTDYGDSAQLWKNSTSDITTYRAKLWHEFAALVVQRTFIQKYLSSDYPQKSSDFELFYQKVKLLRQDWIKSRLGPVPSPKTIH